MPDEKPANRANDKLNYDPSINSPRQTPANENPPSNSGKGAASNQEGEAKKIEREIRSGEQWLIGIGIASIVVNAFIALIYYGQLTQMKMATEAAASAANFAADSYEIASGQFERTMQLSIPQTAAQIQSSKAARDAVKFAQDSFRQDQRPWLSIKDITCGICETIGGTPHGGNLYDWITTIRNLRTKVVNTGKTPAEDVKVDCNIHIGAISFNFSKCAATPGGCSLSKFDSRNLINFQDRGRFSTFPVPPMDIGSIGPTQEKPVILNPTAPSHTIGLTREYEASVYVEGTISYHSAWGSSGETKFCFFPKLYSGLTTNKEPADKEPANDNYCDTPGSNTMR